MQISNNQYTNTPMTKNSKIVVFGSTGLVGSAIVRNLTEKGYENIIGIYHNKLPTTHYPLLTNLEEGIERMYKWYIG